MKIKYFALIALLNLVSCDSMDLVDEVPFEYKATWTGTSEDIIAGEQKPSFLIVSDKTLSLSTYEDGSYQRRALPILKVGKKDSKNIIIFCGRPNTEHIGSIRFQLGLETNKNFMRLTELEVGSYGRFVRKD